MNEPTEPIVATFQVRITLRSNEEDATAPTISELTNEIASQIELLWGFDVTVRAERTDK